MITPIADIKRGIVAPVVLDLDIPGDEFARVQLMTGIGNAETGYRTRRQVDGPALGYWQVEPRTHDDLWRNWLCARPALAEVARSYLPSQFEDRPDAQALVLSDRYAACIATLVFYRSPVALPPRGNARAQCAAWKAGYNTSLGAGAIDPQHIALFQAAINA
ncbi:hypothetical protein HLH33_02485 [Gluconacetobacter diazotrophicus]|uniref:Uncharacterized protein n=1 Tax=Gluconacetobacter diazotrophicus TaxID=33996 RepID=A0A7W4FCE2_GLUDI|nr:hypothetical protein [Gluconacetobacter diazotrophicus]MBB2155185.1 hypothetical protein [Gluconacetobacter diazotrophicus]